MLNNKGEREFTRSKQDWNAAAKAVERVIVFRKMMKMNWLPTKTSLVIIAVIDAELQNLLFVVNNLGRLAA